MNTTRRMFLKSGAIALVSSGLAPASGPVWLRDTVYAAEPNRSSSAANGRKILICIFQRGAVDGMSMVVPHGDPNYYVHRSLAAGGIAIPRSGEGGVIDLDGTFGLHPALSSLKSIWDDGHLAAIHACGSPSPTRSHFDAQDYMESGAPGNKHVRDGWLSRAILACPEDTAKLKAQVRATALAAQRTSRAADKVAASINASPFRSVSLTTQLPRIMQGTAEALAIPDLRTFGVKDSAAASVVAGAMGGHRKVTSSGATKGFEALYDQAVGDVLHGAGKESFEAMKMIEGLKPGTYVPARGARYPRGKLGESLQQIAQLIKAGVGVEVAFAETGGWDTHAAQGSAQGSLARRLQEFGDAIKALYVDLGDRMADVTILTMSEFGRTVRQNGTGGTDHGHATCFFTIGDKVNGGKVLGEWPGLAPEQLYENRDLAVTTDFRDVFAEVAQKHLGVRDLQAVFPGYDTGSTKFRNVIKST
ncbi:MAG: hypothetical protein JWN98_1670 [Abditibacteriota bacterium]|nr:hypothetical protein [Abditibacteriota bacterium]